MKRVSRLLALVLVVAFSLLVSCSQGAAQLPAPTTSQHTPTPVSIPRNSNLVNGIITVQPGGNYNVRFTVNTSTMQSVRVIGTFQASGGSGNDIKALIMDDMAFTNWSNGHQVSVLYNSGQITVANINTPITSPGSYYLVFSNDFSTFSSKNVNAKVDLNWTEVSYQ